MNDKGVWGPWSKTWSFTARGPAYPLDVTLDYDPSRGRGDPQLESQSGGPAAGQVPGLRQRRKGFHDRRPAIPEHRGRHQGGDGGLEPVVPGELHRRDLGHGTGGAGPRSRSARSQQDLLPRGGGGRPGQAERAVRLRDGPRPIIYSKPRGGSQGRAPSTATRSVPTGPWGPQRAHEGRRQVSGYFDLEKPKFAIAQGPAWLKIDEATGVLSGTPDATGKVQVAVTATIDRQVRKLDERTLVWGIEKVLATTTERVGAATQSFVIEVR